MVKVTTPKLKRVRVHTQSYQTHNDTHEEVEMEIIFDFDNDWHVAALFEIGMSQQQVQDGVTALLNRLWKGRKEQEQE